MKKLTTLLAVMAMVFVMSGKARAVEIYYTFEGTVTSVIDDAGAVANAGLAILDSVTYTFIVDFDADGSQTFINGDIQLLTDNANFDYFYTDYVSGDALVQVDGGNHIWDTARAEWNLGADYSIGNVGYLAGNSDDDFLQMYSGSAVVSDWVVGTAVTGYNYAYDSNGVWSELIADLTLTDISPVSAVPEPATILLLGSGLIGLAFFRRKTEIA